MSRQKGPLPTRYALEKQRKQELAATAAVRRYCTEAFGPEVGAAVVGVRFTGGVLTIHCAVAALVQELEQFHRAELLAAVRLAVPTVARILVQPA